MLSPKKKNRQTRRYVCTCLVNQCASGRFIDANGIQCRGVELSPEAFEAHQRAHLQHQAQEISTKSKKTTHLSLSASKTGAASEQDLISQLEQVVISPNQASRSSDSTSTPSGLSRNEFPISDRERLLESQADGLASTSDHTSAPAVQNDDTSEDCLATNRAREAGIQPYSCG